MYISTFMALLRKARLEKQILSGSLTDEDDASEKGVLNQDRLLRNDSKKSCK